MIDITTVKDNFNIIHEIPMTIELPKKKKYFWVIILVLLIIAGGFLYYYMRNDEENKVRKISYR